MLNSLETHMSFYKAGLGDRLEYEFTFNDYSDVIKSTDADFKYVISNICLEIYTVSNEILARQINEHYSGRTSILYDSILRHRKGIKDNTLWNITVNVPTRSMKGILIGRAVKVTITQGLKNWR